MIRLLAASLLCFSLALTGIPAAARCSGAVMLGGLHDAYRATLAEPVPNRQRAAMALLVLIGTQDAAALARLVAQSGKTIPVNKLEQVLTDAKVLAKATLNGTRSEEPDFRHGLNVDWLSNAFIASGCQASGPTTSRSASAYKKLSVSNADEPPRSPSRSWDATLVLYGLTLLSAVLTILGGYKLYTSFFMRRHRVERMPRFPISLPLDLTYTDAEGHMREAAVQALDISQGGLKLDWPDPPEQGTLVTLPLLAMQRLGRVSWSNTYFAGIMFDTPLTQQELKSLKETHKDS